MTRFKPGLSKIAWVAVKWPCVPSVVADRVPVPTFLGKKAGGTGMKSESDAGHTKMESR